jgi:hypothetical protein
MMKGHCRGIWVWGKVALLAVAVAGLLAGCGSSKTGKLVGVQASMGLNDLLDGVIDKADFAGIVLVELKDGTRVDGIWDKALGSDFVGGMELEIQPTKDPKYWKVVKIISTPPVKKD